MLCLVATRARIVVQTIGRLYLKLALGRVILHEPERVAIRIVHVELARTPTLINRAFMDMLGSVWITGGAQSSIPKLSENCVNVIARNDKRLAELAVATMAGENELVLAPG